MNREWWAGPVEAYIYNEFADALREGMRTGVLQFDDLMTDDAFVLGRLDASGNAADRRKARERPPTTADRVRGYSPRIIPKERWLDPPVQVNGTIKRLSLLGTGQRFAAAGVESQMIACLRRFHRVRPSCAVHVRPRTCSTGRAATRPGMVPRRLHCRLMCWFIAGIARGMIAAIMHAARLAAAGWPR